MKRGQGALEPPDPGADPIVAGVVQAALSGPADHVEEALDALADAVGPVAPSASAWARLRAMLVAEPFGPFEAAMADLLKVPAEAARRALSLARDDGPWETLMPGIGLVHIPDMAHHGGADVGFVRVADGLIFPLHEHGGGERGLVLRGHLHDEDGRVYGPGDAWEQGPGTRHTFRAEGDLLYAVVVYEVSFPGLQVEVPHR